MLLADPACLIQADGRRTLYAEALYPRVPRGEIWSAELRAGQHPSTARFSPLLASDFHMSYPFPFHDGAGGTMLTMESWQAGYAPLLRSDGAHWYEQGRLLNGRSMLDPTIWRGEDRWWLFCTFRNDGPDSKLHLFHTFTLGEDWVAHPMNSVKQDFASARPAGPLFMADGRLIRPAQDSSQTYGGAVTLNVVEQLNEDVFVERPIRRLEPVAGPYGKGLHTFCPAGDCTLIDGKMWRFDAVEFGIRGWNKVASTFRARASLDPAVGI